MFEIFFILYQSFSGNDVFCKFFHQFMFSLYMMIQFSFAHTPPPPRQYLSYGKGLKLLHTTEMLIKNSTLLLDKYEIIIITCLIIIVFLIPSLILQISSLIFYCPFYFLGYLRSLRNLTLLNHSQAHHFVHLISRSKLIVCLKMVKKHSKDLSTLQCLINGGLNKWGILR